MGVLAVLLGILLWGMYIIGILGYFLNINALLIIGAILSLLGLAMIKGAPYPKLLIAVLSIAVSGAMMFLLHRNIIDSIMLCVCIYGLLANLSGFYCLRIKDNCSPSTEFGECKVKWAFPLPLQHMKIIWRRNITPYRFVMLLVKPE